MSEQESSSRSDRLNVILAEYREAVDAGKSPDEEQLIAQHPEFTEEFREYFVSKQDVENIASSESRRKVVGNVPEPKQMKKYLVVFLSLCLIGALAFVLRINFGATRPKRIAIVEPVSEKDSPRDLQLYCHGLTTSPNGDCVAIAALRFIAPHDGIYPYVVPPVRIRSFSQNRFVGEWSPQLQRDQKLSETHIFHFEYSENGKRAFVCRRAHESEEVYFEVLNTTDWSTVATVKATLGEDYIVPVVKIGRRHISRDGATFVFCSLNQVHVRKASSPDDDILCVPLHAQTGPELSPDGSYLIVDSFRGVTVYSTDSGEAVWVIDQSATQKGLWSPDSRTFALLLERSKRKTVVVFDVTTSKQIMEVAGKAWEFCDKGSILATSDGRTIKLWRIPSGTNLGNVQVRTRKSIWTAGQNLPASLLASGARLLCTQASTNDEFSQSELHLIDVRTAEVFDRIPIPSKTSGILVSSNDRYVAISNFETQKLEIWSVPPFPVAK